MPKLRINKYLPVVGVAFTLLSGCGGSEGSNSNELNSVTVNGAVEKGPYIIGSNVAVGKLNGAGQSIDSTLTTQTINDLGDFSFSYEQGALVQIKANGYYRNEITGELSAGTLNLRSIYVVSSENQQNAHVNILTHLASNRVLDLISKGTPASEAISTAKDEMIILLDEIAPSPSIDSFASLGLYDSADNEEGNAYLTLISSLFYQYSLILASNNSTNPDAELTLVLNELASDFADGNVEDPSVFNSLQQTMAIIDPVSVQQHLIEIAQLANSSSTPANINLFLDSDLDGITNEYDPDDDNDNIPDNEDSTPYQENFIVNNLNLETDEDTDLSFFVDSNNPKDININFVVTQQPNNGVLIGEFPNIIYRPNPNFNGIDTVILYLSQEDISSESVTISISVLSENDTPAISGTPQTAIEAYNEYSFTPVTNDIDGDGLMFTILNKPDWISFSTVTGEISGTPTNDDAGEYSNISISTSDGVDEVSLTPFSLTVTPTPWISLADMPLETRGGAAAEYDGTLYYFGGTASDMKSVYAYNIQTNNWSTRASMPKGIHILEAHTIGDKIYIISGYGAGGFINDTLEYDPINDSWITKTARPIYRYIFSSAEVNGLIYVIGGQGPTENGGVGWNHKNYVEIYNPVTDSWSNGQPAPTSIAGSVSCVLDEKIYVVGGNTSTSGAGVLISEVNVYDPSSNTWSTSQDISGKKEFVGCAVIDQTLFVFGGRNSGALSTVESYDTLSNTWTERHPMITPKYWSPVLSYGNKAYIFGGQTVGSRSKSVEVYDASIDQSFLLVD